MNRIASHLRGLEKQLAHEAVARARSKILILPGLLTALLWIAALPLCAADQGTATSYRNGTLTGCVEEQPGPKWVLRDVKQGKLIAELDPIVYPGQSLAKYVGRQARLQGRLSSGANPAVMRVRTIKALSGPCAPAR